MLAEVCLGAADQLGGLLGAAGLDGGHREQAQGQLEEDLNGRGYEDRDQSPVNRCAPSRYQRPQSGRRSSSKTCRQCNDAVWRIVGPVQAARATEVAEEVGVAHRASAARGTRQRGSPRYGIRGRDRPETPVGLKGWGS